MCMKFKKISLRNRGLYLEKNAAIPWIDNKEVQPIGRTECGYGIGLEKPFPSRLLGLFVATFSKGQKFFYLSGSNCNFLMWILQKRPHCSKESVQLCSPESAQMFSVSVDASWCRAPAVPEIWKPSWLWPQAVHLAALSRAVVSDSTGSLSPGQCTCRAELRPTDLVKPGTA